MTDAQESLPVIMFVDDEATAVKYFQRAIGSLAPVITAESVEEGIALLDVHSETLAVLVSDQRMPGKCGNELLRYARDRYPHMVRILTTAYSELEQTVEAINQGQIHRYIKKPWEITTLRMELKQALEFANLRKQHDYLMREKMIVRQKQIISNRIGTLNILCSALIGRENYLPLESYLSTALKVGVKAPEPDWMLMDYSDLVSAEASRSAEFNQTLVSKFHEIRRKFEGYPVEKALEVLATVMPGKVTSDADTAVFVDEQVLTEYLESTSQNPVSPEHAAWLAFLLWLNPTGWSPRTTRSEVGLQCRLVQLETQNPIPLATWIEQF